MIRYAGIVYNIPESEHLSVSIVPIMGIRLRGVRGSSLTFFSCQGKNRVNCSFFPILLIQLQFERIINCHQLSSQGTFVRANISNNLRARKLALKYCKPNYFRWTKYYSVFLKVPVFLIITPGIFSDFIPACI